MHEILFADNLKRQPHVRHAFFTRGWGDICFFNDDFPPHALKTRTRMADYMAVAPENFLFCRQKHTRDVVAVTEIWEPKNSPVADAMVTDKPGIALGVLTADCVPALFATGDKAIIGVAHVGWRGALIGVMENTLKAMEKLGAKTGDIHVALGPAIEQKSYEVGPEFPAPFVAESADNEKFFMPAKREGHYQFDLKGYAAAKLRGLGAGPVEILSADTCADPDRFYSYRYAKLRGLPKNVGRLVSALTTAKR